MTRAERLVRERRRAARLARKVAKRIARRRVKAAAWKAARVAVAGAVAYASTGIHGDGDGYSMSWDGGDWGGDGGD